MARDSMRSPYALDPEERGLVVLADNLALLAELPDASVDLIYIDPPFNTGKTQKRVSMRNERDPEGDRTGFQGIRYRTERVGELSYRDAFDDYLGFLAPRIEHARRLLKPSGSLYFHIDYREVHYCKLLLDSIFGRECFLNEIIWAYDYGARATRRWPAKHDNILFYVRDPERYHFDTSEVDRIPYLAPALVGAEKAERGKLPTDTWWHTIVSPTGKEKLGYPTQKPVGVLERIVRASCPRAGLVLDFFAGSGTAGAAALRTDRRFIMVDSHRDAYEVMQRRFADQPGVRFVAP
jgi:site-specific DNA-methyltransferase (adenine-specific)